MAISFSSLTHRAHAALTQQAGVPLRLGHTQQLLAGALGYASLAAYQAAAKAGTEPPALDGVAHAILDGNGISQRLADLGLTGVTLAQVVAAITAAFGALLPKVAVHESVEDFADDIHADVEAAIEASDEYAGERAELNADDDIFGAEQLHASADLNVAGDRWVLEAEGTAVLRQHPDAVYHGHRIHFTANAVFPKLGRRLLDTFELEDVSARISDSDVR